MTTHRRDLLRAGIFTTGSLLLGFTAPIPGGRLARAAQPATEKPILPPTAFIQIAPDNSITLIMPDTECGQGIWTSAAMLIAEELNVGMDRVQLIPAPPNLALYAQPLLGEQATGGSTSIMGDWQRLREAGARARIMLTEAAARKWGVDPSSCAARDGVVFHDATGRSASYGDLAEAANALRPPAKVELKPSSAWQLIGTSQKRLDTPAKVNGTAIYGIDVQVPGMKIGTVAASPVIGGTLAGIDEDAARRVPGVRDVVKLKNAVAVIGDHFWAAKQGLEAAAPRWNDGENARVNSHDIIAALAQATESPGVVAKDANDAPGKIAAAATKVEAIYQLPFLSHAPMEPINTTIHIRPDGADVWVGTQVPVRAQNVVASIAGLKPEQVTVHNYVMGGAFGRRLDVDSIEQAAEIAKQLSYPVKLIWTREEDITHDLFRPRYYDRLSAGLDASGKLIAWTHRTGGSSVMARWLPAGMTKDGLDPDAVEGATETPYDVPAIKVDYVRHESPGVITAWWRGVGPTHNVFVVESFVDECAAAAGKDPVEFRRSLLGHSPRALAVLNLAADKAGWGTPLPKGVGRGVSLQHAFESYLAHILEVEVTNEGEIKLRRATVAIDCGQRVNPDTIEAQIQGGLIFGLSMAMFSDITHENGRVQESNFNNYRVLRMNEAPVIEVYQIDSHENPGGIGETGTAAASAALCNAIYAASGKRLRSLPFGNGALQNA
jgi:isoquinoline 1-oxidoreductase beta subunit